MLGAERIAVPAPRVEVVDTVGAGDSFMSALLSAMDRDGALGAGSAAPDRGFARTMASVRRLRLGDHLHAQGIEPADPRRSRGRRSPTLTGAIGLWVKGGAIAGARRQG